MEGVCRTMIDIGVKYILLNWHFWLGLVACLLANFLIMTDDKLHYKKKWLYLGLPILFAVLIFVLGSILSAYVGEI